MKCDRIKVSLSLKLRDLSVFDLKLFFVGRREFRDERSDVSYQRSIMFNITPEHGHFLLKQPQFLFNWFRSHVERCFNRRAKSFMASGKGRCFDVRFNGERLLLLVENYLRLPGRLKLCLRRELLYA